MQGGSNLNYIFYQTKTKFSNTGDALINKSLINYTPQIFPFQGNYKTLKI